MNKERFPLMYDPERIAVFGIEQCQYWMDLAVITDGLPYNDTRQEEKRRIASQWLRAKKSVVRRHELTPSEQGEACWAPDLGACRTQQGRRHGPASA